METHYVHKFLNKQLQDLQYATSKHCGSQEEVTSYSMLHQNIQDFRRTSREGLSRLSGKVHLVCVRQAYWTTHRHTSTPQTLTLSQILTTTGNGGKK